MIYQCDYANCFTDTTCALGHPDRTACTYWKKSEQDEGEATQLQVVGSDVAWNGYALGTSDLAILAGRGQPVVVGLIGPEGSGKTSLLAFVYMWLLKHGRLGDRLFAGSWTLGGWESVVRPCRWTGNPPPSFPPHTSSTGRHPGILHVVLRHPGTGAIRDVMFTDAPGEWFTEWSRSPRDPQAAGAQWVIDHSDVLVLLVDSAGLADARTLPVTRRLTYDLIERVAAESSVPVVVVWTKDDVEVPDLARSCMDRACKEFLPKSQTLKTTTATPESIDETFAHVLCVGDTRNGAFDVCETRRSTNPFLAFRGIHVNC